MRLRFAAAAGARGHAAVLTVAVIVQWLGATTGFAAQPDGRARARPWPCRLVVKPTLLDVVEDGWQRSPTFRRQCEDLAAARAVVVLEWGTTDSQSRAISRMRIHDGVIVARVTIPPVAEAIELVAHELQHVLEKARGMDFEREADRPGSGVWRAFGGYETQTAIAIGRQVARECREKPSRR